MFTESNFNKNLTVLTKITLTKGDLSIIGSDKLVGIPLLLNTPIINPAGNPRLNWDDKTGTIYGNKSMSVDFQDFLLQLKEICMDTYNEVIGLGLKSIHFRSDNCQFA